MDSKGSKISTSNTSEDEEQSERSKKRKTNPANKKSEVTGKESKTDNGPDSSPDNLLEVRDPEPSHRESSHARKKNDGSDVERNKQETSQTAISEGSLKHDLQAASSEFIENKDGDESNKQKEKPLKISVQEQFQQFLKDKNLSFHKEKQFEEPLENKDYKDSNRPEEEEPSKIGIQEQFHKFLRKKELDIPEKKSSTTKNEIGTKEIEKVSEFEPKGKRVDYENENEIAEERNDGEKVEEGETAINEKDRKVSLSQATIKTEGSTENEIIPVPSKKESSKMTVAERLKKFWGTTESNVTQKVSSQTMEEKEMADSENQDETKEERNDKETNAECKPDSNGVDKDSSLKAPTNTECSPEKEITPASSERESPQKTFTGRLKVFFETTKSDATGKTWEKDEVSTIGSEAAMKSIEKNSSKLSIIVSGSSKKVSSDLSASKTKIDNSTLSSCIESSKKVTPELVAKEDEVESSKTDMKELQKTDEKYQESDKEESRKQRNESRNIYEDSDQTVQHRKAVLPSISSTSVVIEPEEIRMTESTTDESKKADDPFSVFLNALQKHELRRLTEDELEPLGHQDFQTTIDKTNEDIQGHFSKAPVKRKKATLLRKSSMKASPKPSTKLSRMTPQESEPKFSKNESPSKTTISRLSPSADEITCEWEPGKFEPRVGYYYRLQSWVGDYILGYDYWSKEQHNVSPDPVKEVRFNIDDHSAWYDQPMSKSKISKSALDKRRDVTMKKIEALKVKAPESVKKGGKQLPIAYDPKELVAEDLKQDLKHMFMEFAKTDPSPAKNRMSLKNVDKWLERVGLLDHTNLTLVHTGLCFIAAGGNRYHGLTFEEFFTFVEMISDTLNKPIKHCINRMKYAVLDLSMYDRMK